MSITSNKAYVKKLMRQMTRAVDIGVQEAVEQTLVWVVSGTVQDSGNAAFFWNVGIGGGNLKAENLRGTGHKVIGDRGDARQPASSVQPSAGLSGLATDATISFSAVINRFGSIKKQIVSKGGKYPAITIHNDIGSLGKGFEEYERNALFLVAVKEGEKFGPERGYEIAEVTAGAAGIVKKV